MPSDFSFASLPSFEEIEKKTVPAKATQPSLVPEHFMVDESLIDRDYTYMKQMNPPAIQTLLELIEDFCDHLEYEGSFLYDEAPDKTTVLKLADTLTGRLSEDTSLQIQDLIRALLCDEILFRRQRYYRKKKMFQ